MLPSAGPPCCGLLRLFFGQGPVSTADTEALAFPRSSPDRDDVDRLIAGSRVARRIYRTSPFAESAVEELSPEDDVQTDDEGEDHLRQTVTPIHHPAGTCRTEGMPGPVGGNTNTQSVMIGEKAADMIPADAGQGIEAPSG